MTLIRHRADARLTIKQEVEPWQVVDSLRLQPERETVCEPLHISSVPGCGQLLLTSSQAGAAVWEADRQTKRQRRMQASASSNSGLRNAEQRFYKSCLLRLSATSNGLQL